MEEPIIDIKAAAIGILCLLPVSSIPLQGAETALTTCQASLVSECVWLRLQELPCQTEGLTVV